MRRGLLLVLLTACGGDKAGDSGGPSTATGAPADTDADTDADADSDADADTDTDADADADADTDADTDADADTDTDTDTDTTGDPPTPLSLDEAWGVIEAEQFVAPVVRDGLDRIALVRGDMTDAVLFDTVPVGTVSIDSGAAVALTPGGLTTGLWGDLDGDGVLDLTLTEFVTPSSTYNFWKVDPDAPPAAVAELSPTFRGGLFDVVRGIPTATHAGDDEVVDFVIGDFLGGRMCHQVGPAADPFDRRADTGCASLEAVDIVTFGLWGDLTADGEPDLISTATDVGLLSATVEVFQGPVLGPDGGVPVARIDLDAFHTPWVADLDGDGAGDLLLHDAGTGTGLAFAAPEGDLTEVDAAWTVTAGPADPTMVALFPADVSGDGQADLIAVLSDGDPAVPGAVNVVLGPLPPGPVRVHRGDWTVPLDAVGSTPLAAAVDFDGDGRSTLIVHAEGADGVWRVHLLDVP